MKKVVGTDLSRDMQVLERFTGTNADGEGALVQRTAEHDYAQFNNFEHPKSHGWWQFPLGTFTKIATWGTDEPPHSATVDTCTKEAHKRAAKDLGTSRSLPARETPFEDRSGESMHMTMQRIIANR